LEINCWQRLTENLTTVTKLLFAAIIIGFSVSNQLQFRLMFIRLILFSWISCMVHLFSFSLQRGEKRKTNHIRTLAEKNLYSLTKFYRLESMLNYRSHITVLYNQPASTGLWEKSSRSSSTSNRTKKNVLSSRDKKQAVFHIYRNYQSFYDYLTSLHDSINDNLVITIC